jgi:hypothetical protein
LDDEYCFADFNDSLDPKSVKKRERLSSSTPAKKQKCESDDEDVYAIGKNYNLSEKRPAEKVELDVKPISQEEAKLNEMLSKGFEYSTKLVWIRNFVNKKMTEETDSKVF